MRWFVILLVTLAGCDTASPAFRGIEPVRITVGKSVFAIRVKENRAEAIRLNPEWAPRIDAVAPRAVAAIEKVSGCEVIRLDGDQALMVARLKCGKAGQPMEVMPGRIEYDCDIEDAYGGRVKDARIAEMTCTARSY